MVLTIFMDLSYFSADRGLGHMDSEFSLAIGSWVRESIYVGGTENNRTKENNRDYAKTQKTFIP